MSAPETDLVVESVELLEENALEGADPSVVASCDDLECENIAFVNQRLKLTYGDNTVTGRLFLCDDHRIDGGDHA